MAHLEVFEGTWEELAVHAEIFQGRKLILIVLPAAAEATESVIDERRLREAAAQLFAEADCIEREPGPPSSDPYTAAFGEMMVEKHRKMGLRL